YNACKFRAALGEAMALAREANGYLARKAHWFQRDRQRNARLRAGANHPVSFSSRGLVPHAADESAHKGCL
ncbi:MAG: hypothetical protein JXR84_25075, partial [Anaerolineae bacterium]|nr:hypothetical protein [Anaerolineae bacterium]